MGNYRNRGGDIYREVAARREQGRRQQGRRRGPGNEFLGRLGRGAAVGAAAFGTGVGIGALINNEREQREEDRN